MFGHPISPIALQHAGSRRTTPVSAVDAGVSPVLTFYFFR
jgi:hypothetical protein